MLLDDLYSYLNAQGVASLAWPLYEGFLPDDFAGTGQAVAVFETGGYPPTELNRETETVTFQLRVRASKQDYATGRAKWKECFDALQDAQQGSGSPGLLPGVVFIQALHNGPATFYDGAGRPNFTSNFRVKRYNS